MYTLCKLLYITVFGLLSAAPPYLQLYYHDALRFSSGQIGLVLAIAPFIQSFACPVWTGLADKRPILHGPIMAFTSLVGGLAIMGMMVLGHIVSASKQENNNNSNPSSFAIQDVIATFLFNKNDKYEQYDEYIFVQEQQQQSFDNYTVVWVTSALALVFAFFTLPNVSLVDSAVMKILGPNKILYGEQRLWGSVSTGLTILIVGVLMDITGSLDAIFWVFGGSTIAFIVCALKANITEASDQLSELQKHGSNPRLYPPSIMEDMESDPKQTLLSRCNHQQHEEEKSLQYNDSNSYQTISTTIKLSKPKSRHSILSTAHTLREDADGQLDNSSSVDLSLVISPVTSLEHSMGVGILASGERGESSSSSGGSDHGITHSKASPNLFKSPRVLCFLTTTLLFGIVLSMIVNFLFLFLSQNLHTPASWIGWTGPLGGLTELLCFCFSKQMTECLGTTGLVIVSHVATIIRCLVYTILPPDSFTTNISALLLQTLHGIGFGIFWGTAVSEMDSLFPPTQRSMAQGILGTLHTGLGTGGGALIGGYLYEYFGAVWLFRSAAGLGCISMVIFCVGRLKYFDVSC
ncbi:major facilitator superfamily domain-containing protein [Phascolomyces articulosus]|uniref:Major facilitator superfamily domain-containing protein n=1 Tax=Phascolomyces articulosus TaxID=60185 RepID=A0AAD5JTR8_9FUNG|nr:major facilitator superfamily domain-containing protein [Phascolomyces articulosus]